MSDRPMYEKQADLAVEDTARQKLEAQFGLRLIKMPISYKLDFAAVTAEDEIKYWIEFKRRQYAMSDIPSVMLSFAKYEAGWNMQEASGCPFMFAVEFNDCLATCWMYDVVPNCEGWSLVYGGRTKQRRDYADVEPVVMIPIHLFKVI